MKCTARGAFLYANSLSSPGSVTIEFDEGVYTGAINVVVSSGITSLTLTGMNGGAGIKGDYSTGQNALTMNGGSLTVTNMNISSAGLLATTAVGGGMWLTGVTATFTNCGFMQTTPAIRVPNGMGMRLDSSTVTITDSFFTGLSATTRGGALDIVNGGTVTIDNCDFTSCASGANGGAIASAVNAKVTITNSRFVGNAATTGFGASVFVNQDSGLMSITGSSFTSNQALYGAGVYNLAAARVTSCNFTNNLAVTGGGALYGAGGSTNVTQSRFTQNRGISNGAVVELNTAAFIMSDSIIDSNSANDAGVLHVTNTGGTVALVVRCNFTNNLAGDRGGVMRIESGDITVTNSFFGANSATSNGGAMFLQGTDSRIYVSQTQMIGNSAQSGGAISMTDHAVLFVTDMVAENNNAASGGVYYLNQNAVINVTRASLSQNAASSFGAGVYTFGQAAASFYLCTFTTGTALYGGGAGYADLQSLVTFVGCQFTSNTANNGEAGAMFARQAAIITIQDCLFQYNTATQGGALYGTSTTKSTLTNCIFEDNVSILDGGAILYDRAAQSSITDTVFTRNRAQNGGGIASLDSVVLTLLRVDFSNHTTQATQTQMVSGCSIFCQTSARLSITDSSFRLGQATSLGGAINLDTCLVSIVHSNFTENTASFYGGALYANPQVNISDSLFESNSAMFGGAIFFEVTSDDSKNNRSQPGIVGATFSHNQASGAGGAVYWEYIIPFPNVHLQGANPNDTYCADCIFLNNTAEGYGDHEATAAGRIDFVTLPPVSVRGSDSFGFSVMISDFFRQVIKFTVPNTVRSMQVNVDTRTQYDPVTNASVDSRLIGAVVVPVTDGQAGFSNLFVRGASTNFEYYLQVSTTPSSVTTSVGVLLRNCDIGFYYKVNPDVFFECDECASGQFDLVGGKVDNCTACVTGAICDGADRVYAEKDFWHDPYSPDALPEFLQCIPGQCCVDGKCALNDVTTRCAEHRDPNSTLCGKCMEADGYYEWNFQCVDCTNPKPLLMIPPIIVMVIFTLFVVAMGSHLSFDATMLAAYAQIIALVIGPVHSFMPFFNIFMFRMDIMALNSCLWPFHPFNKLIFRYLLPGIGMGVALIVISVQVLRHCFINFQRRARGLQPRNYDDGKHADALLNLLLFFVVPVMETTFQLLICRQIRSPEDGGATTKLVLPYAPDVTCYHGEHSFSIAGAVLVMVMYLLVFPPLIFLHRRRKHLLQLKRNFWMRDDAMADKKSLRREFFWWEVVIIWRGIVFTILYVIFFDSPTARTLSMSLCCLLAGALHCFALPYEESWDNVMEAVGIIFWCYTAYLFSFEYRFPSVKAEGEHTDAYLRTGAIFIGFGCLSLYFIIHVTYRMVRRFILPLYGVQAHTVDMGHART